MPFYLATEDDFRRHWGRELANPLFLPTLDDYFPAPLKLNPARVESAGVILPAATNMLGTHELQLMQFVKRDNQTKRPQRLLTYSSVVRDGEVFFAFTGPIRLTESNSTVSVFVKLFDPSRKTPCAQLSYKGILQCSVKDTLSSLKPRLCELARIPCNTVIRLFECVHEHMVNALNEDDTVESAELITGDIIVIQPANDEWGTFAECYRHFPAQVEHTVPQPTPPVDQEPSLGEHLRDALADPMFSDVTLKVGNELIQAHRVIICRLPFFMKLLSLDMIEARAAGVEPITLKELDVHAFKHVLNYVYSGTFYQADMLPTHTLLKIITTADYLGATALVRLCYSTLEVRLTAPSEIVEALCILENLLSTGDKGLRGRWVQLLVERFGELADCMAFCALPASHPELFRDIIRAAGKELETRVPPTLL